MRDAGGVESVKGVDDEENEHGEENERAPLTPGMLAEDTPFFRGARSKSQDGLEGGRGEVAKETLKTLRTRSKY